MEIDLAQVKTIDIFVDENKNLAFFSFVINTEFSFQTAQKDDLSTSSASMPPVFHSKVAYKLKYPYTSQELAALIEQSMNAWNKLEPYTSKRVSIEEYYYKTRGFKKATLGKRLITLEWNTLGEKTISIMLPVKAGKYYLGMESKKLPNNSDWIDASNTVIDFIEMDITQTSPYKTFRRKLNV